MKKLIGLFVLVSGCVTTPPPPPPTPLQRVETRVDAPIDAVWNSVIDVFSSNNMSIKTIDKSSGLIVSERNSVSPTLGEKYAYCGTIGSLVIPANYVDYNIRVSGENGNVVVKANASWRYISAYRNVECESMNVWEQDFEKSIVQAVNEKKK